MSTGVDPTLHHVGLVSPSWPPGQVPNGVVTYTHLITQALRQAGRKVTVFAMEKRSPDEQSSRVQDFEPGRLTDRIFSRLYRDYFNYDRPWPMIVRAVRACGRKDPLEVLEMEESFGWPGPVSRALGLPVVIRMHGPWILAGAGSGLEGSSESRRRNEREGRAFQAVAGVVSPTRFVLDSVRRHYGLPLAEAAVIPCPQPLAPEAECWRLSQAVPETVLFVGRFDRIKGGDLVVEAFGLLLQRRPQAKLVFVGPDRGFLDEKGRTWSLPERLKEFLGEGARQVQWLGELPRSQLSEHRSRASVVLVASRSESFPYTALEGLTLGCPLVVSDAGGLPEMVQDGRNGLVFRSGDAAALAGCLERVLGDRELGARLGAAGRSDVAERYDPDRLARQTLDYYSGCRARWRRSKGGSAQGA